jgi:hypothetical protein
LVILQDPVLIPRFESKIPLAFRANWVRFFECRF